MSYFSYFPLIRYKGRIAKNLLVRTKIIEDVLLKRDIFYEYVIQEGDLPDTLADRFYGNPELDWIIYLSNDMLDPYTDWPLGYSDFNRYLEKKYGVPSFETKSLILHYRYTGLSSDTKEDIRRKSWIMSVETYNMLPPQEQSGWTEVTAYQYEDDINEEKRVINIIKPIYVNQILDEIEQKLSE